MNIFEDLIEELKEENLLETTVIETGKLKHENAISSQNDVKAENASKIQSSENKTEETSKNSAAEEKSTFINQAEFYRKRAVDEVTFLQIVEHVFAGVEREQLQIVPKSYNDLEVKKILHNFLQMSPDVDAAERSKAEFQLLQETESWHSSLTLRDERMTTAHLRRYCEKSRPPLSSPALVALARFYRNSPYSEPVRNKFDLVVTRLFSKENGKNRRELVFSREELITHLTELYAEWSSVPLYSTEPDDAGLLKIAERFEDFIWEADDALGFDDLMKTDFFTRLHSLKRSANENFYAPLVTATGVECNIRIGNRYVELLELEKKKGNVTSLEDKYGFMHDYAISEATSKTFSLIELLKQKKPQPPPVEERNEREYETINEAESTKEVDSKQVVQASKTHKWVIVTTVLAVMVLLGFYFGTGSKPVETEEEVNKPKLVTENSILSDYIEEAQLENGALKGIVLPMWNQLLDDQKKDILKQMVRLGGQKGYDRVQLIDKSNKTVAVASEGNIQLIE